MLSIPSSIPPLSPIHRARNRHQAPGDVQRPLRKKHRHRPRVRPHRRSRHRSRLRRQIPHGQAIALGMLAAAKVSLALRTLSSEDYALHESLLQKIGVPLRLPDSLDVTKVFNLLPADNKRGHIPCDNNQIAMVLLRSIGRPCLTGSKPLIPVPHHSLKRFNRRAEMKNVYAALPTVW